MRSHVVSLLGVKTLSTVFDVFSGRPCRASLHSLIFYFHIGELKFLSDLIGHCVMYSGPSDHGFLGCLTPCLQISKFPVFVNIVKSFVFINNRRIHGQMIQSSLHNVQVSLRGNFIQEINLFIENEKWQEW